MRRRTDDLPDSIFSRAESGKDTILIAGPSSSLTIPGVVVHQMTHAIGELVPVVRVDVDSSTNIVAGLHRAPSLAAAHDSPADRNITRYRAPQHARLRGQMFRSLMLPDVSTVVAYAWPGLDNSWIRQIIQAGRSAGKMTIVACASLPQPNHKRANTLASTFAYADVVLVGDKREARELATIFGRLGPIIEAHSALSLEGRGGRDGTQRITAFLPKDDAASLSTLLRAFDAFPEAWIEDYNLQVVMRFGDNTVPRLVRESYHEKHIDLIDDKMSSVDLHDMFTNASALSIASPAGDSRVFASAMKSGIGTVVLDEIRRPEVGRGYVGGLLADRNRIASVHVALTHALRLAELQFPSPEMWDELAQRIVGVPQEKPAEVQWNVGV